MQDTIILGNGNSKQIKTASLPDSYTEFKAMAENGNLLADINLNADGCEVVGTPLNKLNLLTDETSKNVGNTSNPNDAFNYLGEKTSDLQNKIGDISGLLTKNKNDVVSAINELTADRKVIEERTTIFSGTATWDETRESGYESLGYFKLAKTNLEEYDYIEIVLPPETLVKYYNDSNSRYEDGKIYLTANTIKFKVKVPMPTSTTTRWIYDDKTYSMVFGDVSYGSSSSNAVKFTKKPIYVKSARLSSYEYHNDELVITIRSDNLSNNYVRYITKADIYGVKVKAVNE